MDKKAQFYLLTTIIIIGLIFSFAAVINFSQERTVRDFDYLKYELNIESEKVMDNALINNRDMKETLINFSKTYSTYSEANNLYYIFGNWEGITVAGYRKFSDGKIFVNVGSGNQELSFNKEVYLSRDFINPQRNIKVTVNDVVYDFSLSPGENFYFILSKEIKEDVFIITNGYYDPTAVKGAYGNGIIERGEECDDGNLINGDGCSSTSDIESGWTCSGSPSSCQIIYVGPICGNGVKEGTEQCDDGNRNSGDGCSSSCQNEGGGNGGGGGGGGGGD